MKKSILAALALSLFLVSCGSKKEEKKEVSNELNQQIEAVDSEVNKEVEALEKEAKDLDDAINELDNL